MSDPVPIASPSIPQNSPLSTTQALPSPGTPPPLLPPSPVKHSHHYLFSLILFLLGIILGFGLLQTFPFSETTDQPGQNEKSPAITLPPDAVLIQGCSNGRGTLYIRPEDIPVGPVYLVHDRKVIGMEFMLRKEEFLAGKSYKQLPGGGMSIDHVNIGLLSEGHEGFTEPHYHVDIYTVPKTVAETITCPQSTQPTFVGNATGSAGMEHTLLESTQPARMGTDALMTPTGPHFPDL